MNKPEIIAFYLPQYHPTSDNDKWYGKGFTEWTNVGKARPLFKGHYQPKVPADLGYYDLRVPEVRELQAGLAKEAGISAFCYYHYWFGNGKEELQMPLDEVTRCGRPDFPFCICWANESWHSKFWNNDGTVDKKMLVEQTYPGDEDIISHFHRLLPTFKDERYYKVDGENLFMIYKPFDHPQMARFINIWQSLAIKNGLPKFHFIAQIQNDFDNNRINRLLDMGFNKVNPVEFLDASKRRCQTISGIESKLKWFRDVYNRRIRKIPYIADYVDIYKFFLSDIDNREECCPTILPNWDHSPRSIKNGFIINGCTPELFKSHIEDTIRVIKSKQNKLIFLKSWNEWGEGNYMEPDLKFGHRWITTLRDTIDEHFR